jgi:succinoglycan biosynthesis protein ExoM
MHLGRWRRFWSVLPQARAGRPFVHATSNVLVDLAAVRDLPRPLFDEGHGLSGGGDLVFFSRLFDRGVAMAWATDAVVREEVPPGRASLAWLARRRRRVGNHMVMDEEARQGRLRPILKTAGLLARLPVYPLLGREPGARLLGWRMEAVKLGGRLAAHRGLRSYEYARDGVSERRIARS